MTMSLIIPNDAQRSFTQKRESEVRLGEKIKFLNQSDDLSTLSSSGIKYALVGIPEDIGVRANGGRAGAKDGWNVFLRVFLNRQSNRFLDGSSIAVVGEVSVNDIKGKDDSSISELRELCSELDKRVRAVVEEIFKANLIPIVIGGGHNNAYPILKGFGSPLGVLNIDAHADFRMMEGRHSGNPFSYAHDDKILTHYAAFGLHEGYNSEEMLQRFTTAGYKFVTFESIRQCLTSECSTKDMLGSLHKYLPSSIGLEVDLDSMAFIPTSAATPVGFSVAEVGDVIEWAASNFSVKYLHLPEGAPSLGYDGERTVGRTLSYLVSRFISASAKKN